VVASKRLSKGQGHLLREEILRVTAELMRQVDSPDNISVRAVALAVNRTTPQIYEHFDNREHLLHEAANAALADMAINVAEPRRSPKRKRVSSGSGAATEEPEYRRRLRARAHAYVDFAVTSPIAYRLLFMSPSASDVPSSELLRIAGMDAVVQDLTEAHADGRLAFDDIDYVAFTLWVMLHGVASLHVAHPRTPWPPGLLDRLLDQMTVGLVPRTG
jgi:AcrR family transcriptional regulator